MQVHWYPGHMAKTKRLIAQSLKQVDGVLHLADARLPRSSQNPLIDSLAANKLSMLVLTKADLADPAVTDVWTGDEGTLAVSLKDGKDRQRLLRFVHNRLDQVLTKRFVRPWRVMVVGIPNVGKSTLINSLAKRKSAKVGNKPGVTRTQQWIKIAKDLEMLDMPGILWPRIDDRETGLKLAASGCIKDEILPVVDVAQWLLSFLRKHYPAALEQRYGPNVDLAAVGKKKGALRGGGRVDLEKTAEMFLWDFRVGRLGRISLDVEEE